MFVEFLEKEIRMDAKTIVVGGGMAGMSCAKRLRENGQDVLLVTEHLGGRVYYDPKLKSNFGAVFCMANYKHSLEILDDNGPLPVSLGDLMLHTSPQKEFKVLSPTFLGGVPQLLKFRSFMNKTFMPEYAEYKKYCETHPVAQAFKKYPNIERYYRMKASDAIAELGIAKAADNFINKFAYACTGSRVDQLNALDFLNVTQGAVVALRDFTFDGEKFTKMLGGRVKTATVEQVHQTKGVWHVKTADGEDLTCENLVVATTANVTQKLLDIPQIRQPTLLVSYLVKATPNADIAKSGAHYYGDVFDVIAIGKRPDGLYNVYTRKEIDLGDFFTEYDVLGYKVWPCALYTYGDTVLKQDWADHCWIAGDMNGLGLEPACISGIYAANRILGLA